jgi:hypothetical protein
MSFRVRHSPRFQREDPIDQLLVRSAHDDEFDNDVLDPSWIRTGSGTFDDVTPISPFTSFTGTGSRWSLNGVQSGGRPSWYTVQIDVPGVPTIRKPIAFPTDCFIWTRISFSYLNAGQTNNDSTMAMVFIEPTSNDQIYIHLNESDTNTVQVEFARIFGGVGASIAVTNNVGGAGTTKGQVGHVVGIQKLGTVYHAWVMSAAGNWLHVGSATHTGVAPTHAQLAANSATTSPGNWIVGFDFFRFRTGRLLP